MTLPNSTIQGCTKMSSDKICQKVKICRGAFLYSYKCCSIIRFFLIFLSHIAGSRKWISPLNSLENLLYVWYVTLWGKFWEKNSQKFIHLPFVLNYEWFFTKNQVFFCFWMIDNFPIVRPIKHVANFPGSSMVISIFY